MDDKYIECKHVSGCRTINGDWSCVRGCSCQLILIKKERTKTKETKNNPIRLNKTEAMKKELILLMEISQNSDLGPNPTICRWCSCWLSYGDTKEKHKEEHEKYCFAVLYLDRPKVKSRTF